MTAPDSTDATACEIASTARRVRCDRIVTYPTRLRVLILQHFQEQDALLGSAQIVAASLPKAKIVVGHSWRNLGHALGEEGVDASRWAVLFPDREAPPNRIRARSGDFIEPPSLEGIIVLDGTWSKAKTLWWRNAWLNKLNRMNLKPAAPSIYGRLRAEPKREFVSTLESVTAALTLCGEPAIDEGLARVFARWCNASARDLIPPPAKRPARRPRAPQAARAPRPPAPGADES